MKNRLIRSFPLALFLVIALAGVAEAQTPSTSTAGFNLSWSALDPGNDWAWTTIQSVFPVNGTPPTSTGTAANVIGQIVGQLTGFVMAIAMAFLCYLTIINIHRVSETSTLLTNSMTTLAVVRIGFAAIMMFPLASGFSVGQAAVIQAAGWGIGMARSVYANVVQAIGPDAMVIANPQIPGTRTIVLNLMQDELCAALVNQAAASTVIPTPTATVVGGTNGGVVTYAYAMTAGNATDLPTCGTISVAEPLPGGASLAGVSIDMANRQQTILNSILSTIRSQIQAVAQSYWQTKNQSALSSLQSIYQNAVQSYTSQLTSAAQAITAQLRSNQQAQDARNGNLGLIQNETQLSSLGWTSAGAYYLEFARLNKLTLSLASGTPTVNMPSFQGLSPSLQADLAPLFSATTSLLSKLRTYVNTTDGLTTPGGNADTMTGQYTGSDGSSLIEQVFRALNFTPSLLNTITNMISPTANQWSDPFGGLIALGNELVMVAMTALGLAGIASSATASTATAAFNILTFNWGAAAATVAANLVMQFFANPIFYACMALLMPGLTIAFVLPMIPWVMWMAGVAGYLILVCEAFVAVPLWMLSHMTFEGDGLHGRGGPGYELLFNVLFRPVLMLLGLFLGYFVFASMSWLIRMSFGIAAGFVLGNGWIVTNWLGLFVLLGIFVLTHIIAAITSFRMIALIPHHLPRMLGFGSGNRVDMDEFSRGAALIGAQGTLDTVTGAVSPRRLAAATRTVQNQLPAPRSAGGGQTASSTTSGAQSSTHLDTTLQATTEMRSSPELTEV